MSVFFYTFRTNKYVAELEEVLREWVYIIDKPAQDFDRLLFEIEKRGADKLCGIGMVNGDSSRFEPVAYNKSAGGHADSKIVAAEISLSTPKGGEIKVLKGMTNGPCNYVAFRLACEFPDKNNYFVHLLAEDIDKLQAVAF